MTTNLSELKRIYSQAIIESSKVDDMFMNSARNGEEIEYRHPVINLLFRSIIEKIDALILLFEHGVGKSADSMVRDLFENYIYLLFMIRKDDNKYARAYMYQAYNEDRNKINRYIRKEKRGNKEIDKSVTNKLEWLNSRIDSEAFREIKKNWIELEKRKPPFPKWYSLFKGPNSFGKLCNYLNFSYFYNEIYGQLSHQTHSLNILDSLNAEGYIDKIRNGKDSDFRNVITNYYATYSLYHFVNYFHRDAKDEYKQIFLDINQDNTRLFE